MHHPRKWNCQIPRLQKLRKQASLFRSCTLCVQGSAQKQDVAEPPCRPPSLTLSVHGAREGPAPRAQVSSLLARPCPLPGVSAPLGGVDSLPVPSSPDGITAVDLVNPRAKRPRAAAGRWRPGVGATLAVPAPAAPRPLLGLLGVESPGDPACTGRLPDRLLACPKAAEKKCRLRSCTRCVQGLAVPLVYPARDKDPRQGLRLPLTV